MSSKFVRDEFRSSWASEVPTIPFYETVNENPDHTSMPALWATAEFVAFNEEQVSLGNPSCRREPGTITVVLAATSGTGDATLIAAAETVRTAYRYWSSGDLRVIQVDPPLGEGFSDGNWYIMDIDIQYVYDIFV